MGVPPNHPKQIVDKCCLETHGKFGVLHLRNPRTIQHVCIIILFNNSCTYIHIMYIYIQIICRYIYIYALSISIYKIMHIYIYIYTIFIYYSSDYHAKIVQSLRPLCSPGSCRPPCSEQRCSPQRSPAWTGTLRT